MTWLAILGVTIAGAFIALFARDWLYERRRARWEAERRAIDHAERVAAHNGRPYSTAIVELAPRRRP